MGQDKIHQLFAFILTDDGREDIPAMSIGGIVGPLIGSDMKRVRHFTELVRTVPAFDGHTLTIARFGDREDIGTVVCHADRATAPVATAPVSDVDAQQAIDSIEAQASELFDRLYAAFGGRSWPMAALNIATAAFMEMVFGSTLLECSRNGEDLEEARAAIVTMLGVLQDAIAKAKPRDLERARRLFEGMKSTLPQEE